MDEAAASVLLPVTWKSSRAAEVGTSTGRVWGEGAGIAAGTGTGTDAGAAGGSGEGGGFSLACAGFGFGGVMSRWAVFGRLCSLPIFSCEADLKLSWAARRVFAACWAVVLEATVCERARLWVWVRSAEVRAAADSSEAEGGAALAFTVRAWMDSRRRGFG